MNLLRRFYFMRASERKLRCFRLFFFFSDKKIPLCLMQRGIFVFCLLGYLVKRQSAQQALWSDSSGPVNFASALPGSAQVQSFVSVEIVP